MVVESRLRPNDSAMPASASPSPNSVRRHPVRRATAGDVARVAPLFDAYRVFYGRPSDLDAARGFLARRIERDDSVVLIARAEPSSDDGEVAGFAQLYR